MFISHKSNVIQSIHDLEWECRKAVKGIATDSEYWTWLESVTTDGVVDYSGETGYTIVECTDEDVNARLSQLSEYFNHSRGPGEALVYNIKWSDDKVDGSHFTGDDTAKDARILADEWTRIRTERDRLLANSDWTQGGDTPLASDKKTAWATYRTKLRDVPKDQKDKTTYASITWPSEPS